MADGPRFDGGGGDARAYRACLGGCLRRFLSEGPGHRICKTCRDRQSRLGRESQIGGRRSATTHPDGDR